MICPYGVWTYTTCSNSSDRRSLIHSMNNFPFPLFQRTVRNKFFLKLRIMKKKQTGVKNISIGTLSRIYHKKVSKYHRLLMQENILEIKESS